MDVWFITGQPVRDGVQGLVSVCDQGSTTIYSALLINSLHSTFQSASTSNQVVKVPGKTNMYT